MTCTCSQSHQLRKSLPIRHKVGLAEICTAKDVQLGINSHDKAQVVPAALWMRPYSEALDCAAIKWIACVSS